MRAMFAIVLSAIVLAGCNQDNDVTGSVESCAKQLYTPYNPKDMKQCVAACIACERGTTTTCTTSCTLKGAR
jgi:PBP1b-binding outer membrane lipoprotein LpoB